MSPRGNLVPAVGMQGTCRTLYLSSEPDRVGQALPLHTAGNHKGRPYRAASIFSMTIPCDPPFVYTVPCADTFCPANGITRSFWPLAGFVSEMGQYIVPSSARITKGEPALAHSTAQSALIGLLRFFVSAQAES